MELDTCLYYWDESDGPQWQGWWITPDHVGNDRFFAFSRGAAASPDECRSWRGGDRSIDMCVASLGGGAMGVRASGLGFEGVYERESEERGHGRPAFRRTRDLTAAEAARIDAASAAAPSTVVYSQQMTLADLPSSSEEAPAAIAVGVPLDLPAAVTPAAALEWVRGGGEEGGQHAGAAGSPPEEAAAEPMLRLSLRVESAAELDQVVRKEAAERLSLPELSDEESPLPVGWVLAERSAAPVSGTVRRFLLLAAHQLEEELPESYRSLPQVRELAASLRRLVVERGFTLCVWADG